MKIAGKWKISLENRKDIANKHTNFAIKLFNYSKKKTEYFFRHNCNILLFDTLNIKI